MSLSHTANPGVFQTIYNTKSLSQSDAGSEQVYYYLTNHLSTPVAVYDASGTEQWRVSYLPFGEVHTYYSGSDFHQPIRFPGQYYDDESGLHYNWNRYYDPGLGTYNSTDPILLSSSGRILENAQYLPMLVSSYLYGVGNPLLYVDSDGAISAIDFGGAIVDGGTGTNTGDIVGGVVGGFYGGQQGFLYGGAIGFLVGGPVGAVLGAGVGALTVGAVGSFVGGQVVGNIYEGVFPCEGNLNCNEVTEFDPEEMLKKYEEKQKCKKPSK